MGGLGHPVELPRTERRTDPCRHRRIPYSAGCRGKSIEKESSLAASVSPAAAAHDYRLPEERLHAVPIPHTFHRPVFVVVAAAAVLIHIDYCVNNGADDNNHCNHNSTQAIQVWKGKGFRV